MMHEINGTIIIELCKGFYHKLILAISFHISNSSHWFSMRFISYTSNCIKQYSLVGSNHVSYTSHCIKQYSLVGSNHVSYTSHCIKYYSLVGSKYFTLHQTIQSSRFKSCIIYFPLYQTILASRFKSWIIYFHGIKQYSLVGLNHVSYTSIASNNTV